MTLITLPARRSRRRQTRVRRPARPLPPAITAPYVAIESPITHVVVAVPARNEAASITACLDSIDLAAAACGRSVIAVVAADSCVDATADIARRRTPECATTLVVEGSWRSASGARGAAVAAGLGAIGELLAPSVWIANTDADCVVPVDWLRRQLHHCGQVGVAVAGIVRLDESCTHPSVAAGFAALYDADGPLHRHVHGANLGLRADAYEVAGGWRPHTVVGEEHDLWRRLARGGVARVQPTDVVVTTSGRRRGRTRGGFASNLLRLERALCDD